MIEQSRSFFAGFIDFVRTQGVVGLAVGFILGGSISKLVASLVTDIINPLLGLLIGGADGFKTATVTIGSANIAWGSFVAAIIDFIVIALVVYYGVKIIGVNRLDKPKE